MVLWRHPSMAGPVTGLQPAADGPTLRLADGQVSLTRSVLITTGVSYRRLDAPGLDSLPGAGVFHGATASEAAAFAREHLFIAGGANSAGQAAVNQAHIMTGSGSHPLPCPNCRRPRIRRISHDGHDQRSSRCASSVAERERSERRIGARLTYVLSAPVAAHIAALWLLVPVSCEVARRAGLWRMTSAPFRQLVAACRPGRPEMGQHAFADRGGGRVRPRPGGSSPSSGTGRCAGPGGG
jgi:hypothetical protein